MISLKPHTTLPHKGSVNPGLVLLLWAGIASVILGVLILASVPPVSRDALTHHLTIPKMYLAHGGIYEIPSIQFSYFPMNLDLLYLSALYFKQDIAAKYIHFLFALLTAGLIFHYLAKRLNRTYGLLGALFFLTIPVIVKLSVTVYVDLGLIFFSWASLYLLVKWNDSGYRPRFLVFSGIACGLALGTKYNGLILLPILGAIIPILYSYTKNREVPKKNVRLRYQHSFLGLGWAVVFMVISMAVFSPWMARNILWKQNPIYPLYDAVFNPPVTLSASEVKKDNPSPKNAFWVRRHVYGESFLKTLSIPIRVFFQGKDDDPRYFDGRLNPFLLLLPIVALVRVRRPSFPGFKTHRVVFTLFAVLIMLFVFFLSDFRIRYMAPAIPPLVVLSIFGIKILIDRVSRGTGYMSKVGPAAVAALLLSAFVYNGDYIHGLYNHIRPFDYLSGRVDRDGYISRYRREYPVILYANKTLPGDARVLCLSMGGRTYYVDRPVHLAEDFYEKSGDHFSKKELLTKLTRYHTTHVLLDRGTLFDWLRTLPKADQDLFLDVFKENTRVVYEKNNVLLLALEVQE